MNEKIFGFIGCGNMGGALAQAAGKNVAGENILLADFFMDKAKQLAEKLGASAADNQTLAEKCDYLFLGVKPQMMADMLGEIRDTLLDREEPCVLVTMAAGLTIETIRRMAGVDFPVIRIMPNIPAAVGQGMLLCCSSGATAEQVEYFREKMQGAGVLDFVEEKMIDAGSAVSGCGPAFAAMMIEALADGGVACGLPRAKAQLYAAQTLLGSAKYIMETGMHPGALKDAVCSPAGSTIQGVRTLENSGFRSAAFEAVIAAYDKTLELGKH